MTDDAINKIIALLLTGTVVSKTKSYSSTGSFHSRLNVLVVVHKITLRLGS